MFQFSRVRIAKLLFSEQNRVLAYGSGHLWLDGILLFGSYEQVKDQSNIKFEVLSLKILIFMQYSFLASLKEENQKKIWK